MAAKTDHLSNILIVVSSPDATNSMVSQLKTYLPDSIIFVCPYEQALDMVRVHPPDIIVFDMNNDSDACLTFLHNLKMTDPEQHVSVIVYCKEKIGHKRYIELLKAGAAVISENHTNYYMLALQIRALIREITDTPLISTLKNQYRNVKHELDQRIKELQCLYGIAAIRERPGTSLDEILQGIVNLIPPACQQPEITCARISMGYQEFTSQNFKATPWKHTCDIQVNGEWGGTIELFYLEQPENHRAFFFQREVNLLKVIGERIGRIAERVLAEESLRIEGKAIVNILKSMEDMVCKITDHYTIEYINPSFEKEFGRVNNKTCYEYFYNRETPCPSCGLEYVLSGHTVHRELDFPWNGKTYDILETPLKEKDGTVSKLSILRDLSDLKTAQKDVEERELLYRNLTESVADGVVLVQDRKIAFVNSAFVRIFNYNTTDELIGKSVSELFDKHFIEIALKIFDTESHDPDLNSIPWLTAITSDGKEIWIAINRSVIRLKSKPGILATIRDVTDQVMWEKSIQEETEKLRKENIKLKNSIKERYKFSGIIGKSPAMQKVYELILKAAASDANVLVLGESGTGKDLVARAIHDMSDKADKPFVVINCGAIPEDIAESEFFGHRKGSFTGAYSDKTGFLHAANNGTLFLDEVAELSLNMQVKFLRALESGEYTPVGDTRLFKSNFRVIAATNRNFSNMVAEGLIREDFYYRISVIPITIAPLRERKEDIPLLVEHFLKLYTKDKKEVSMPAKHIDILMNYRWPGNVRELQSALQRYLAVGNLDFLNKKDIEIVNNDKTTTDNNTTDITETNLQKAIQAFEKQFILKALNEHHWHRGKVASKLGINPKTLYIKMKKMRLS